MNILFITANRLGDAVLSTGLLRALIDLHPNARFTVACGPLAASLFSCIPEVARVIVMIKQPWHGHWRSLWLQTVETRWSLIVDLRNTVISRMLRRESLKVFRGPTKRQHMVEALAAVLNLLANAAAPRLWLEPGALDRVTALAPRSRPLLALAPGAQSVGKRWPAERYATLAAALLGPGGAMAGGTLAVLGAPGEQEQARPALAALPTERTIDLVGKTDPLTAGAWLTRADLYVGNDSGLTHLAAAAGAPTLALFGPGLPARYRPWGGHATYLIPTDDPDRALDLCKIDDRLALDEMKKLPVDLVVEAAAGLYRRRTGA